VTHPTGALNDVVHHRHRLGILTIASEAEQVEFGYLREALDLTAGNLNRHLAVLEDAGLVAIVKGYAGRRPKTWVRITRGGRKALAGEMAVLEGLVRTHRRQAAAGSEQTGSEQTGSEQTGSSHTGSGHAGSEEAESRQTEPGRPEPEQPGSGLSGSGRPGLGNAGSGQAVGGPDGVDDLADHAGQLEVLGGEHEGDAQLS
jgi:DNA-binding MarR family transcriptional regulator